LGRAEKRLSLTPQLRLTAARPLKEHRPILQRKVARRAADFCETVFQVE
jgi:hypothetical protein